MKIASDADSTGKLSRRQKASVRDANVSSCAAGHGVRRHRTPVKTRRVYEALPCKQRWRLEVELRHESIAGLAEPGDARSKAFACCGKVSRLDHSRCDHASKSVACKTATLIALVAVQKRRVKEFRAIRAEARQERLVESVEHGLHSVRGDREVRRSCAAHNGNVAPGFNADRVPLVVGRTQLQTRRQTR